MFKVSLLLFIGLAVASAQRYNYPNHNYDEEPEDHKDYYAAPHYAYKYDIHDPHTGDLKSQHETREGDVVKGYYIVKEADGTMREVHYTADKHNGFNAVVKRTGQAVHQPAPKHNNHNY